MNRKTTAVLLILLSGLLCIGSYLFLPSYVMVWINAHGKSGVLPKLPAVLIPMVLSIGGSVAYAKGVKKAWALSLVGICCSAMILFLNL